MRTRIPASLAAVVVMAAALPLPAQQPPPPPPGAGGASNIRHGNLDLSKVPVPAADLDADRQDLTAEERKAPSVKIHIIPVGQVPPPIIHLDKSGMPRETARNPLECAPAVYLVKTRRGAVRIMAAQNQVGPAAGVPARPRLELAYQVPPAADDPAAAKGPQADGKVAGQHDIGEITVPEGATHLAIILWKDPAAKLWTKPMFQVVDISPGRISRHEALVVNLSGMDLELARGDKPGLVRNSYIGKVALPVDDKGQVQAVISAVSGKSAAPLTQTRIGVLPEERLFLLAWSVPKDRARPLGIVISPVTKRLFTPDPPATGAVPGG